MSKNHPNPKRRRRKKVDDDQLNLLWSDEALPLVTQLRLIDRSVVELRGKPISFDRWKQIYELAIAIVFCGSNDGCRARVIKLITVADKNSRSPIIGSKPTFHRVWRDGVALGIFRKETQSNRNGNAPAFREVVEERVSGLFDASCKLRAQNDEIPEKYEPRDTHLTPTRHSPDTHCPIIENQSNHLIQKTKRSTVDDDQKSKWTEEQIEIVRREANCITAKIGPTKSKDPRREKANRSLLCKACYLVYVSRTFSEHWLHDAVEGVVQTKPKNRWAYFQQCLYEKPGEKKLKYQFARLAVPAELLQLRAMQPAVDLKERQWDGGEHP